MTESDIINNSRFELTSGEISLYDSLEYILAGKATFTLLSVNTGKRFTYQCNQVTDYIDNKPVKQDKFFLSLLNGPDNTSDYMYAGMVEKLNGNNFYTLRFTAKSKVTSDAISMKAFILVLDILQSGFQRIENNRSQLKIYHDGNCAKCGRKLTDPISVAVGRGPVCAKMQHKQYALDCKKRNIVIDKKNNVLIQM